MGPVPEWEAVDVNSRFSTWGPYRILRASHVSSDDTARVLSIRGRTRTKRSSWVEGTPESQRWDSAIAGR